jgi:hypothetical protein
MVPCTWSSIHAAGIDSNLCHSHLFAISGGGKTRLSLDGLCHNWGIYISCRADRPASGSGDFAAAAKMLATMGSWNQKDLNAADTFARNADAAERVFAMLLCARIFILHQFLQEVPGGTTLLDARRRWVLAQALPATYQGDDVFVRVITALRNGDTSVMRRITWKTRTAFSTTYPVLFTTKERLFVVIDGSGNRPILREMYKFFNSMQMFVSKLYYE